MTDLILSELNLGNINNFSKYLVYLYDTPKNKVNRELTFNEYIMYYSETITEDVGSENFYNLLNKILNALMNPTQKGGKVSVINNLKKHKFI